VSAGAPALGERFTALARLRETRFVALGIALLPVAVLLHRPAARLAGESRLESSLFVAGGDAERRELARLSYGMYLPHRRWLSFASLGNAPLAADVVWIKSAGYVTREFSAAYRDKKFEWLRKLHSTVFDLDPSWSRATYGGAMILGAVRQDPASAVDLLHRSMLVNSDAWYLPYQAGVTCLLWPGHTAQAVTYFREAVRRPGHPPILEQAIPRLMSEAGWLDEAVRHARVRALSGGMTALAVATVSHLAEFVSMQLERDLADAVAQFKEGTGRYPARLEEIRPAGPFLVQFDVHFAEETILFDREHAQLRGLAAASPAGAQIASLADLAAAGFINAAVLQGLAPPPELKDAYDLPFRYDPVSGTVRSTGYGLLDARRAIDELNAASINYASRVGRRAASLEELASFFGGLAASGKAVRQDWARRLEIGRQPGHPFAVWGERHEYDPLSGRVAVPAAYEDPPRPRRAAELAERASAARP
jgi:hypothetical protein